MSRRFTLLHLPGAVTLVIGQDRQAAIDFSGSRVARDVLSDQAAGPVVERLLDDGKTPPALPWAHLAALLRDAGVPLERLERAYPTA